MLTLMTFKYYVLAVAFALFFPLIKDRITKKRYLMIINLFVLCLLFFDAKKHFLLIFLHSSIGLFLINCSIKTKKWWFSSGLIIYAMMPLLFFKYTVPKEFILSLFPWSGVLLKPLTLLGVSFYTFKLLSVIIDVIYERITEKLDFESFFIFLTFFPCILSGPLDRYQRFNSDLQNQDEVSWKEKYDGLFRLALGVFKKIVLADILWNFSNSSYNNIEIHQLASYKFILGQYAYCLMLYFDFSGYSDIAIGVSGLLGIRTPENFNRPFLSRNLQVFWNSWHMSFMNWLKDYLFFPAQTFLVRLGLKNLTLINIISYFLIFILAGLWHGEGRNFLYYGIFQGGGFTVFFLFKYLFEKKLSKEQRKAYLANKKAELLSIFVTLNFFVISLIFFINKQEVFIVFYNRIAK